MMQPFGESPQEEYDLGVLIYIKGASQTWSIIHSTMIQPKEDFFGWGKRPRLLEIDKGMDVEKGTFGKYIFGV